MMRSPNEWPAYCYHLFQPPSRSFFSRSVPPNHYVVSTLISFFFHFDRKIASLKVWKLHQVCLIRRTPCSGILRTLRLESCRWQFYWDLYWNSYNGFLGERKNTSVSIKYNKQYCYFFEPKAKLSAFSRSIFPSNPVRAFVIGSVRTVARE